MIDRAAQQTRDAEHRELRRVINRQAARIAELERAVLRANALIDELPWEGDGLARMEPDRTNALRLRNVVEAVATVLDAETLGLLGRTVEPLPGDLVALRDGAAAGEAGGTC